MPPSALTAATRAFVKVLLSLALAYDVALKVNGDSAESEIRTAYCPEVSESKESCQSLRPEGP